MFEIAILLQLVCNFLKNILICSIYCYLHIYRWQVLCTDTGGLGGNRWLPRSGLEYSKSLTPSSERISSCHGIVPYQLVS